MKKGLIIIIVILVLIIIAGAAYFLFFSNSNANAKKEPEPEKIYTYSPGDYFVTNIKDSKSLLKTTITLAVTDEKASEFLTEKNHVIRDIIVFTLRDKTETELRSSGIQETLRKELVEKLSAALSVKYIKTVYFDDYVLQ